MIQSYAFDDSYRLNELTIIDGISKMADGDFIIRDSISLVSSHFIKALMLRNDDKGNVKWVTRIYSTKNSFGTGESSSVLQQNDKIIIRHFQIMMASIITSAYHPIIKIVW